MNIVTRMVWLLLLTSVLTYISPHTDLAFSRPTLHIFYGARQQARRQSVHSWHDDVFWQHILARYGSGKVQVRGPSHAFGRFVLDRWVGGARNWELGRRDT